MTKHINSLLAATLLSSAMLRMSDTVTATATVADPTQAPATTTTDQGAPQAETFPEDKAKEKMYFAPEHAEKEGFDYIEKLTGAYPKIPTFANFDMANAEIPAGFGLRIRPLTSRSKTEGEPRKLSGFIFAVVPSVETVLANPKGAAFIENALVDQFDRKLGSAIASYDAASGEPLTLVNTLEGFLEKQTRGEGLADYALIAKDTVTTLNKAGFRGMDKTILRHCFMSSQFAQAQYSKVPQRIWVGLLDKAKAAVQAKGKSGAIFDSWKATRDARNFDDGNIDLSDLGLSADMLTDDAAA